MLGIFVMYDLVCSATIIFLSFLRLCLFKRKLEGKRGKGRKLDGRGPISLFGCKGNWKQIGRGKNK